MTENASTAHQFDLESQHRVLLITSRTNPPRDPWGWIYVILQVRKRVRILISSRANKPAAANGSQPPPHLSSALPYTILSSNTTTSDAQDGELQLTSGTTEILPVSLQISGDVHLIGEDDASTATTDEKLQHKNIAKIIAEKDFESLQKFGCVQGFAEALASDLQNGIPGDEEDMSSRRTGGGAHFTTQAPVQGFFKLLIKSSNNYIIFLLLVAAVLSVGFGIKEEGPSTGWYEGGIIVFVIIILVVAPSIRDFWLQTQESQTAMRLNAGAINLEVDVIRGGFSHEVRISDVVSGDIVSLKRGSTVPGDGLCVSGEFFVLDDGTVATINDKKPFLFCGSKVVGGNGRMLVTSVGINTSTWGELMNKVANTPNRAHLPAQLDKVSTGTQIIGISISILILVVTFSRFMVEREDSHSGLPDLRGKPTASKEIMSLIEKIVMKPSGRISILTTSLAIFLLGVVEGIPLFVTLAIRIWNKKTLSGKATAQGTLACVAMGSITTICTNKTGVLNLNALKVDKCYIGDEVIETDYVTGIHTHVREALCNGISTPLLTPSPHCNSTEDPLLFCADFDLGMHEILRHNCTILETKGLSTNEEGSGVLMRKDSPGNEGDMRLHWKGPASTILAMCSHYNDNKGETKVMDEQSILVFNQIIEDMQSKFLKTIAFAYRQTEVRMLEENSLILIALLGVRYSFCTDIVEACQEAGVNIILVSEDNISDLQDIARECGILLNPSRLVIEGKSFRNSNQVNRMDMADKICVMGNSTPSDRLLLVQCLKEKGHVIAMVGVGTNDAPTLKEADVGIAIGTWSNGVARESSDIIIWDKNLSFLVTIGCGRCIYYNIQKYIQLELTMNIAWLLITSITTMCLGQSAIAAIQLVWANMIVTLLGGLALLMEPPTEELMKKEPVKQTESLISKPMWRNIVSQALYQTAVLVTFQYKGPTIPSISKKVSESIVFNSFVLCQVFNQVNSRELEKKNVFRGIFQNLWFWVAVSAILTLQVGFVEIAHIVVGNARLNWAEWGICLLIGMVSWAIDLAIKCATNFILSTTSISRTITPTTVSESASNLELPLINGSST